MTKYKAVLKHVGRDPLGMFGSWEIDFDPPVPYKKDGTGKCSGMMTTKQGCLEIAHNAGIKPEEIKHDY